MVINGFVKGMIAGAALGASISMLARKAGANRKTPLQKTAGRAMKAIGSVVESMSR